MRINELSLSDDELKVTVLDDEGKASQVHIDLYRHDEVSHIVDDLRGAIDRFVKTAEQTNCGRCTGACCTRAAHTFVEVTMPDIIRMAGALKLTTKEFISKYVKVNRSPTSGAYGVFEFSKTNNAVVTDEKRTCPFLRVDKQGTGLCSIYESRPRTCREYSAASCEMYIPRASLLKAMPGKFRGWWET